MSDLADLLVLLHGARGRFETVRATARIWRDVRRSREAFERGARAGAVVAYAPADEGPETVETVLRVWFAPPDLAREEREDARGASFAVRRGDLWWRYDPDGGALSNEDDPEVGGGVGDELWWLLDPATPMGVLDFGAIEPGRCAGRATLRAQAVPRSSEDAWPLFRLGAAEADEIVLDVDAERGTLLRIEQRLDGEPYTTSEVLEIVYDEDFDDDTFVFTPPPGERVRPVGEQFDIQHDLTIEQAVARAPFTVWIPSRLPASWETLIMFASEGERPPRAPHLHVHYHAPDGTHSIHVSESPADHPGEHSDYEHARPSPWQTVERDGRSMELCEPAENWQPAQIRLELDGTRILIHSTDLDATALADFAAGLVRAPPDPPDFTR